MIIESKDTTCGGVTKCWKVIDPCAYYMGVLILLSLCLDVRILISLNYNYINRRVAIISWILDLAIFGGGIWEIIIAAKVADYSTLKF